MNAKPSVQHIAAERKKWAAWAGDTARLRRIVEIADSYVSTERQKLLDAAQDDLDTSLADIQVKHKADADLQAFLQGQAMNKFERQRDAVIREFGTELESREKDMSLRRVGTPDEVLGQIDPRFQERIEITSGREWSSSFKASITFDRQQGCSLGVTANSKDKVAAAHSALSQDIQRGVPWWAFLREWWFAGLYTLTLLGSIAWVFSPVTKNNGNFGTQFLRAALLAVLFAPAVGGAFHWLFRRLLPGFELLESGKPGRGNTVIVGAGMILLALLPWLLGRLF